MLIHCWECFRVYHVFCFAWATDEHASTLSLLEKGLLKQAKLKGFLEPLLPEGNFTTFCEIPLFVQLN